MVVERSQEVVRQPGWRDVLKVMVMVVVMAIMLVTIMLMMTMVHQSGWRNDLKVPFPSCPHCLHLLSPDFFV